ncbi:MAG: hypothetical protein GX137_06615, partial [Thermoplasmatales archaeon]|nr:hypothetical protein [Thermoplasmatales archaeon]
TGGIAPKALLSVLQKSKFTNELEGDPAEQFERLIIYLRAWDEIYPEKLDNKSHTLNKISGIRYMMYIGLHVLSICKTNRIDWTTEKIVSILRRLRSGITDVEGTFDSSRENTVNPFSGESSIVALAEEHGLKLKEMYRSTGYNIFGN